MYWLNQISLSDWRFDLPYWYHYGGLGAVSTTERSTTLYDTYNGYSGYFTPFKNQALTAYYNNNNTDLINYLRLTNLALQNTTDGSVFRLRGEYEDALEKMGIGPTLPDFLPPPPPF